MKKLLIPIAFAISSSGAFAEDCGGKFSESGAFLMGKTFKLEVAIPTAPSQAFNGAYRAVVKEGWKVEQADREVGIITALHGESALKGKRMPLSVAIEPSASGSEMTLQFSTPPGLGSKEADVRDGFCKIVTAAAKAVPPAADGGAAPQVARAADAPALNPVLAPASANAATKSDFGLKWTSEVGETIEVLDVSTSRPVTLRFVKLTYQALKPCFALTVGGNSYSKDGVNLGPVIFKALNVRPGQKFRAEFSATYEPNHYVVLEKAFCEK